MVVGGEGQGVVSECEGSLLFARAFAVTPCLGENWCGGGVRGRVSSVSAREVYCSRARSL